jgi:small subunit ribosomal protein S3
MAQKIHPFVYRLGVIKDWRSRWFSKKNYKETLAQDKTLRNFIMKKLAHASIDSIQIERSAGFIKIIIRTARPGLVIGRGGGGIEELKGEIKKVLKKEANEDIKNLNIKLEIEEVKQPTSQAAVIASDLANQIERRMPYRKVMKQALDKMMQNKEVEGAKIMMKGRLNGAEMARKEWLKQGKLALQTLRADVDYAQKTAYTSHGTIGIKVWIYKGDVFDSEHQKQ